MIKKFIITAVSAVLLSSTYVTTSNAAPKQAINTIQYSPERDKRDYRREQDYRDYRRELDRRYRTEPMRHPRIIGRHGNRVIYDHRNGYHTGQVYHGRGRYIQDYRRHGLPEPRRGHRYYRTDTGDIIMVAVISGIIGMIIADQ